MSTVVDTETIVRKHLRKIIKMLPIKPCEFILFRCNFLQSLAAPDLSNEFRKYIYDLRMTQLLVSISIDTIYSQ